MFRSVSEYHFSNSIIISESNLISSSIADENELVEFKEISNSIYSTSYYVIKRLINKYIHKVKAVLININNAL